MSDLVKNVRRSERVFYGQSDCSRLDGFYTSQWEIDMNENELVGIDRGEIRSAKSIDNTNRTKFDMNMLYRDSGRETLEVAGVGWQKLIKRRRVQRPRR